MFDGYEDLNASVNDIYVYMCTQFINTFTGVTKEMQYIDYSDRKRKHGTRRKRESREKATRKIRNSKRTEKKG